MIPRSFPARLFLNAPQRAGGDIAVGMFDRHPARFGRVFELMMRAFDPDQNPAFRLQAPETSRLFIGVIR